jgi:hypothetical protein
MLWPHDRFTIPGTSGVSSMFAFVDDAPVQVNSQAAAQQQVILRETIANSNTYNSPANAGGGLKTNYPPDTTVPFSGGDAKKDPAAPPCGSSGTDIPTFLDKCLAEASSGTWRESGQGGKQSNPNILAAWKNIGLSCASDQIPWCMVFTMFVMKQTGHYYIASASAADIANPKLKATLVTTNVSEIGSKGQPGDMILFNRQGGHHAAILYQATGKVCWVGGNQTPSGGHNPDDGDVTKSSGDSFLKSNFAGLYRPTCS